MASLNFKPREHDTTQRDFSELPNGIYRLEVETSDVTKTSAGTGTILKTTMSVIEPEELRGRKLFTNFNVENPNPVAQKIGQDQLSSLCRAIWGEDAPESLEDSEHLHFNAFVARVALGKASDDGKYPARAEVKRYYFPDEANMPEPAIDAVQPTPAARPAAANNNQRPAANQNSAAAPARAAGARPWGKK